jgi:hypothetical protein
MMRLWMTRPKGSPAGDTILRAFAALGVLGVVVLALTALVGFEEANETLLLISSGLVFAAPAAMLIHLGLTAGLTGEEKRRWVREFTGSRAPTAFSDYLASSDRRAALRQRTDETATRRVKSV